MICSLDHFAYPGDPDGGVDLPLASVSFPYGFPTEGPPEATMMLPWGSSLSVAAPAQAVARTDATGWSDRNCTFNYTLRLWECTQDSNEPAQVHPVMGNAEIATEADFNGRVVAMADRSWMINGWINFYDHAALTEDLFAWLARLPRELFLFTYIPPGASPLTVYFQCYAGDPGTGIVEYRWDFNDDGIIEDVTTTSTTAYTYSGFGQYQATCTVVDTTGCERTSPPAAIDLFAQRTAGDYRFYGEMAQGESSGGSGRQRKPAAADPVHLQCRGPGWLYCQI